MFHPDRDSLQEQFSKLSNYLTRESKHRGDVVRKRRAHGKNSKSQRRHLLTNNSQRHIELPTNWRDISVDAHSHLHGNLGESMVQPHWYLEEPASCYRENKLRLSMKHKECPLENAAFTQTYTPPINHRLLKCLANGKHISARRPHEDRPNRSQEPLQQRRTNFPTFNRLLRARLFRDSSSLSIRPN